MPDDKDDKPDQPIIDLIDRLGYMLDLGEMARSRLASALDRLGMTPAQFAVELNRMVEWDVTEEAVQAWTTRSTPPGDVLIAAELLVQGRLREADEVPLGSAGTDAAQGVMAERYSGLSAVYPTRAGFSFALPPHVLLDGARDVSIAGLSLNLICQQFSDQRLQQLIEDGCAMRCLFLLPHGTWMKARENEEDFPPGHLSVLTETNMHFLTRLRSRLSDAAQARLRIRTYDEPLRFNIVLVDGQLAVVQPYMPAVRGVDSPTFLLRRPQDGFGLMTAFESVFTWLWSRGKAVD